MNTAYWLNTIWTRKCRREARRFHAATRSVREAQCDILRSILSRNRESGYGRQHQFSSIHTPQDFRHQLPIATYEDYRDAMARIAAGDPRILTCQRVRLFEPTSGSSGGEKLIPYTADLRRQFQRSIDVWIHNLMTCRPKIRHGRAYWSISPCLVPARTTAGGIPIGFDDDVAYLSHLEQLVVRRLLAVPSSVATLPDLDSFRYATLLHLLSTSDLALISIWSPTFLTALLEPLEQWIERICHDLRRGTISWPRARIDSLILKDGNRDGCRAIRGKAVKRAEELEATWADASSMAEFLAHIWPRLQLISCWTDAAASQYVPQLKKFLPAVEIQPKGLLATEACISLPLCDRPGAALAIRSHFFEFEACDQARPSAPAGTKLAHELELGGRYRVVVTTGGGLYRYQLGDQVEVVGFENQCPLIRLLGRLDEVTDMVGEKLAENHVRDVLRSAFAACQITPDFAMLVPHSQPTARYRLLLQLTLDSLSSEFVDRLRDRIESGLMENPYYRHAVSMNQLAPLVVELFDRSAPSCWKLYEDACLARGQKAGDIKPTVLAKTDWVAEAARASEQRGIHSPFS